MTIFGIGPTEFIIILVIAMVVVGPERLPEMMFKIGQFVNKTKRVILDLRDQARAELGEDYDSFEQFGRQIRDLNPRRQIEDLGREILGTQSPYAQVEIPLPPSDLTVKTLPTEDQHALQKLMNATLTDELLDAPLEESLKDTND